MDTSHAPAHDNGRAALSCVLVDDHPAVLDAVGRFLESNGVAVVAALSDGAAAVDEIRRLRPAVAVVDLHLPGIDGIELARRVIEENGGDTAILLYTGYGDVARLTDAVEAGISGFLVKDAPLGELIQAIRMVSGGDIYIDPTLATPLISGMGASPAGLTGDERRLMRMLAEGLTTEDIALALSASRTTAQARIADVLRKLNADTRAQAVGVAIREGWIV
ncbi:MAG: response regulator [Solirubrobacteraceae bacterium]|jgi:DNA-binding NarL/FixJ family response regulator